ncbi:MAG: hypothetical protein H7Z75_12595 [Ferruginibacter sp.]|nr:hypothetical protein [Cytophagales bacterium]
MTEIEYYELLKKSLPEEAAKATVAYIGERNSSGLSLERIREVFATKEDLVRVEAGLRVEIHAAEVETLRWAAALVMGQTAIIFALIKLFVAN